MEVTIAELIGDALIELEYVTADKVELTAFALGARIGAAKALTKLAFVLASGDDRVALAEDEGDE